MVFKVSRHHCSDMQTASASRIGESVHESDDDGVIFGDSCERRVFIPGSNKQNTAVAGDINGAQQRAPAIDPLCALGLFPSSPYALLRQNTPVPDTTAKEECTNKRARRSKSPKQQRGATDALGRGACVRLEQPWTTAAATSSRGKHVSCPTPVARYDDPSHQASFEEIYSPQQLQRSGGRSPSKAHVNQARPALYSTPGGVSFDDDESSIFLLQKLRADEKATVEEAARLRGEADASVMIRRFWRRSG